MVVGLVIEQDKEMQPSHLEMYEYMFNANVSYNI